MNASQWAIGFALLVGSIRAVDLWRAAPRVDVVNVVVLNALAEGRGSDLPALLRGLGASPYFELVRALVSPIEKLVGDEDERALKKRLDRELMVALAAAHRALRRLAWLDSFALVAIVFAGITAAVYDRATLVLALELFAASLLWLSNVRATRSIATRMYAGGTALVDGIVKSLDLIRAAHDADRPG